VEWSPPFTPPLQPLSMREAPTLEVPLAELLTAQTGRSGPRRGRGLVAGVLLGVLAGGLVGAGAVFAAVSAPGGGAPPAGTQQDMRAAQPDSRIARAAGNAPQLPASEAAPIVTSGPASCTAVYDIVQQWPGGFKAEVTVTAGDVAVEGWKVTWPLGQGQSVTQWWNASVVNGGTRTVARNASYNGRLAAGARTTFGFVGTGPATPPAGVPTCAPL
jgi:hypothetical protein